MSPIFIYLLAVMFLSILTYHVYGWDKKCAQVGAQRVPESALHLLELLGGWPGAYLGQQAFRHKTRKIDFLVVYWFMIILHCGAVAYLVSQGILQWPETIQAEQEQEQVEPIIRPLPRRQPDAKEQGRATRTKQPGTRHDR